MPGTEDAQYISAQVIEAFAFGECDLEGGLADLDSLVAVSSLYDRVRVCALLLHIMC